MTELNAQSDNTMRDDLDRVLDAALAKYSAVEPRPGLETRVIATMRGTETLLPSSIWWKWGLAAVALAAVLVAVTLEWRPARRPGPMARQDSTITSKENPKVVSTTEGNTAGSPVSARVTKTTGRAHVTRAATHPKLEQFPSPQPLSEQEQLLASYVAQNRDQAVFVARVRDELRRKDVEESASAAPSAEDDQTTTNR